MASALDNDSMFNDLVVAEKLIASKSKVSKEATVIELNKLWKNFDAGANLKELEQQIANCQLNNSTWVLRKTPSIKDYYKINKVLGHPGQYGVVREAVRKSNNEKLACKILSKHRFRDKKIKKSFFEDIRVEVYLLSASSDHPNIVRLYEVFEDIQNVYMIMSCCDGGELFDRIQSDEGFNEMQASILFRQMVSATYYVHSRGIAHCDLKPENFLFCDKKENSKLVLIDFGMAKIVQWRKYYKRMNGTPYYIAPEVLDGRYNESCDMWSLGVILFIMIFGFPPFFDQNENKNKRDESDKVIYDKIRRGFIPKVQGNYGNWFPSDHPISASCRDLISRLLRTNVADRMTAEEALEHPWINQSDEEQTTNGNTKKLTRVSIVNLTIIHSLQGYRQHCALQSEILKILRECNYLNSSQMKCVKEFFDAADINGDGKISADELYEALKTIDKDITPGDAKSILQSLDANNDGYMDWNELLSSRINRKLQSKEERLRKVFKALDLDNSGKISADELKAALESINEMKTIKIEQCMELIKEADLNNDGEIDFEEFITMFQSQNF